MATRNQLDATRYSEARRRANGERSIRVWLSSAQQGMALELAFERDAKSPTRRFGDRYGEGVSGLLRELIEEAFAKKNAAGD